MLTVTTLASGSGGNSLLVSGGGTHILIDAGISCLRITKSLSALGIDPHDLSAVLVTHDHSDHVCGLATLFKRLPNLQAFASVGTAQRLNRRAELACARVKPIPAGSTFDLGALRCRSFSTPHDAADSVGYTVELDGERMALVTDLGHVTDTVRHAVLGCRLLVLETNHDIPTLRSGPYPYPLKQRILGDRGHLCNEAGAQLALEAVRAGAHTLLLAHLSQENNTPSMAYTCVCRTLSGAGIDPRQDVTVRVAPRSEPGQTYPVTKERSLC